jgi:hypothetical protein
VSVTSDMTIAEMKAETFFEIDAEKVGIVSAVRMAKKYPEMRPVVIDGLLRQGETMNVIGASKAGKSWLIHGLAVSVANGLWWLAREVTKGKVLIIDNELHPETLIDRLQKVTAEIGNGATMKDIDVLSLRGVAERSDVVGLVQRLNELKPDRYRLICIDALYRAIPAGTSESDNAQMMQVYNQLDRIARVTGSAIVLNHHATKGDQSSKAVTDVGSGAGAISRATDTHLVIRPHEDDELCVLEAVCRSFPPPEPKSIRFWWPLWEATGDEPKLKQARNQKDDRQQAKDAEGRELVLIAIKPTGSTANAVTNEVGFGADRARRLLAQLKREGAVRTETRPCNRAKDGETTYFFRT